LVASALGPKVGPVLTIAEGYEPIPFEGVEVGVMRSMDKAATPVESGSLEVRATVTVVFALTR
jgi:uncharacterized protein YggE